MEGLSGVRSRLGHTNVAENAKLGARHTSTAVQRRVEERGTDEIEGNKMNKGVYSKTTYLGQRQASLGADLRSYQDW
jgi:hypothetical protein